MPPQLYPAAAEQEAREALARAGVTVFNIQILQAAAYITTRVRVSARDADRALTALRALYWVAGSGADARGEAYEVWISRRRTFNLP